MNCLRCGKQVADGALFCADCTKTTGVPLQKSPYLSGQVILPVRTKPAPAPKPEKKKEKKKKEEKKTRPRGLIAAVVLLSLLCAALIAGGLWGLRSYRDLRQRQNELISDLNFFDEHVVFVQDGSNAYHSYDCPYLAASGYWIYNVDTAGARGYEPCPYCR